MTDEITENKNTDAVAQSREKRTRHFIVIDEKPMTNAEQEAALEIITHHLLDGTERGRLGFETMIMVGFAHVLADISMIAFTLRTNRRNEHG